MSALAVIVLLVGGFGVYRSKSGSRYPSHWDPLVAPIATQVEDLRGLTFKHPVKVNYLSSKEFEARLTPSAAEARKERAQINTETGLMRAAGLLGVGVDLGDAVNSTQTADVAAFYDPDSKQIYVRGKGAFTIETLVTLAHELTHVLQDQHFDLVKLEKKAAASREGTGDALRALVEGDAVRIQDKYLARQSEATRQEYARLSSASANHAHERTKHIPAVFDTLLGAPYIFGPPIMHVLEASGGNDAINDALTGPTPSTNLYFDPTAAARGTTLLPPIPVLRRGERALPNGDIANQDSFDAFTLYIVIAAQLDAATALRTADAYVSGSEVLYTHDGSTCFRASIRAANTARNYVGSVIRRWTRAVPNAAIDSTTPTVVFHSCDPGRRARTPPDARVNQAVRLAATRDAITATFVSAGLSTELAACVARVAVQQPDIARAIINGSALTKPSPQIVAEIKGAALTCRNDYTAGLTPPSP